MKRACTKGLLKPNKFMISGVAGFGENPLPFLGSVEGPAGELPIHEVHFFSFISICFNANILAAPPYAFDFLQCRK